MLSRTTRGLTLVAAIMLMFGVLVASGPAAVSQEPGPAFAVDQPEFVWSQGEGWVEGRTVTLTVGNDTDPVLYSEDTVVEVWGPGETGWEFDLTDLFDILPGHTVTVTDNVAVTKTLLIEEFGEVEVDPDADTISGLGPPGRSVDVDAGYEEAEAFRTVDADSAGFWVADFSVPGDEGHEQDVFDIDFHACGAAQLFDEDGDSIHRAWCLEPPPNFFVRPDGDEIWGSDWYQDDEVTVSIYDAFGTLAHEVTFPVEDGEFYEAIEFDIVPLDHVFVTNGVFTKDHVVTELVVTHVDEEADLVHGTAEPGAEVFVGSSFPGNVWEHLNFQFGPDNRNADTLNEHLRFRRAVAHAIDRDLLVAEIPGAGYAIDSYVDAFLSELSQHAWAQYPYDPAAATALIDDLCTDLGRDCVVNPPVAVFTTTSGDEDREIMADLLVSMLGAAGIELQLDLEDPGIFFGETLWSGTFDLGEWGFLGARDLSWLTGTHYSFDPEERFEQNLTRWGTPDSSVSDANTARMAELVGLMDSTFDPDLLKGYVAEAELILADQVVIIPLYVREGGFEIDGPFRFVTADADGDWTADFSVPWGDQGPLDIAAGVGGFAEESDEDGDATHAGWGVPAELPPLALKEQARDLLVGLLDSGELPWWSIRFISSAVSNLDASLDPGLWVDDYHLNPDSGDDVFSMERKAAQSLELTQRLLERTGDEVPELQDVLDAMVAADRMLAVTAIEEADTAGGNEALLDRAWGYVDSGDDDAASGLESKAIKDYSKAWEWALRSLDTN